MLDSDRIMDTKVLCIGQEWRDMSMKKTFNTEGPCIPQEHYMVNALRGMDSNILSLVENKKYFVIHAARQSGKTTLLQAIARQINAKGDYYSLYCSLENLEGVEDETRESAALLAP